MSPVQFWDERTTSGVEGRETPGVLHIMRGSPVSVSGLPRPHPPPHLRADGAYLRPGLLNFSGPGAAVAQALHCGVGDSPLSGSSVVFGPSTPPHVSLGAPWPVSAPSLSLLRALCVHARAAVVSRRSWLPGQCGVSGPRH